MKSQPMVTIIIPVYKTEKYLDECISSVLAQDYPNLEILLIDDGSPDMCPKLCDGYAAAHKNIYVIHQKNMGLGLARNTGIRAAKGEYIFFLDSDDKMDSVSSIRKLTACAMEKQADIVTGSFRRFGASDVSEINRHHLREGSYTSTVDFRFKGFFMYGHLAYNWGKLYRTAFLLEHDLLCRAYPFTQDKAHNMACCAYRPVYAFISDSVYLYRVNEESVTFRYKKNYMPVWISIASDFSDFLKERNITEDYRDLMAFHIFFGSFFLVKQELQFQKHGIISASRVLKTYGQNPFVKECMGLLARGHYVREIDARSWRFVIRWACLLFRLHGYWFFAIGIALLRKLQIDNRITQSRYRVANPSTK